MKADSDHLVQYGSWRLYVMHAVFFAPQAPTVEIGTPVKRDSAILVPSNKPIPLGRLIEEKCPNKVRLPAQERRCNGAHLRGMCDLRDAGEFLLEIADSCTAENIVIDTDLCPHRSYHIVGQNSVADCNAVCSGR